MGIKHLWTILTPFCDRKPLYELQGKTVAVDLSCWICEAQNITEYTVQPRMYLRNLYFRTCYLLLMEVNPVFILEGKAPELKYDTIASRNAIQFKGARPKTDGVKTGKDRSRFSHVLKRCEEMLGYMGLTCLKGKGEAENLCAYLNDEGLVDGCISQDSDCFAYGAKVVYRNFSIASQGAYSASGGAVDIYDITKANKEMNFGRNKIIAMALLCGSDYSEGVQGIGKESVLKLFENLSDEEILDTLRTWRTNSEKYEKFEKLINNKNICTSCGHQGKVQGHNKNGCVPCGMTKSCDAQKFKEERLKIKNELTVRSKSLQDPNFPNEDIIQEFLIKKDNVAKLDLKWKQPNLVKFVKFTAKFLEWDEIYAFEKILPILTRWQCLNSDFLQTQTLSGVVQPSYIKKIRNPKGVPSYEIIWTDPEENFTDLIPKEQITESNTPQEKLWSTIEPQVLVNKAYPDLVEKYRQSKIKPKKIKRKKNIIVNVNEVEEMLKNTSISEPKPKRTRKTTKKKDDVLNNSLKGLKLSKKPTLMDNFLKQALENSQKTKYKEFETKNTEVEDIIELDDCNYHTSTPTKSTSAKFIPNVMDMSCFGDEDNDDDLSLIIQNIISRKPLNLEENLDKIDIQNILKEDKNISKNFWKHTELDNMKNSSSFFITGPVNEDLFEQTFNDLKGSDGDDSTIEYDCDELDFDNDKFNCGSDEEKSEKIVDDEINLIKNNHQCINAKPQLQNDVINENDSFCDIYVPLLERLQNKK